MTPPLHTELLTTGSELLLSRPNAHVLWLGQRLQALGLPVSRHTTVPDGPEIESALRDCLSRARLLIVTGGLGPTTDDITREITAQTLGLPLREDPAIWHHIQSCFSCRSATAPDFARRQAMVPQGARVLPNPHGTAPGLHLSHNQREIFLLPGPPRELHPMWLDHVAPWLRAHLAPAHPSLFRTFHIAGVGESSVQQRVEAPLRTLHPDLVIAYCAHPGIVELRLLAPDAHTLHTAQALVLREFGNAFYGFDGDSLESVVIHEATTRSLRLALAESCTGGLIAGHLTRIPGASAVLDRAWVTYSNESKTEALGVPPELIQTHGAVSPPVAEAMAHGALARSRAHLALAVTGIAGPSGGTPDKPAGTVHFALARAVAGARPSVESREARFHAERETVQLLATRHALDWLRRALSGPS